jgi:hypothetical protein
MKYTIELTVTGSIALDVEADTLELATQTARDLVQGRMRASIDLPEENLAEISLEDETEYLDGYPAVN